MPATDGRGGPRHFPKPMVEAGLLFEAFSDHVAIIKDFKYYETLSTGSSVDPKGILYCLELANRLLDLAPGCELHPQPLRNGLLRLLTSNPELNQTQHSGAVWVHQRASRVSVLLAHLRKLARNWPNPRCTADLTGKEVSQLDKLVKRIELRDEKPLEKEALPLKNGEDEQMEAKKRKRSLKKENSDVSLDSQGFPMALKTPPKEKKDAGPCRLLKRKVSAQVHTKAPVADAKLKAAMGLGSSTDTKKPLKKGALKKKPGTKPLGVGTGAKPLGKGSGHALKAPAGRWLKIYRTNANKPQPRSYLCGAKDKSGAKPLIVEVTQSMSTQYHKIISIIKEKLEQEGISKEEALALRDVLCQKYQ